MMSMFRPIWPLLWSFWKNTDGWRRGSASGKAYHGDDRPDASQEVASGGPWPRNWQHRVDGVPPPGRSGILVRTWEGDPEAGHPTCRWEVVPFE